MQHDIYSIFWIIYIRKILPTFGSNQSIIFQELAVAQRFNLDNHAQQIKYMRYLNNTWTLPAWLMALGNACGGRINKVIA